MTTAPKTVSFLGARPKEEGRFLRPFFSWVISLYGGQKRSRSLADLPTVRGAFDGIVAEMKADVDARNGVLLGGLREGRVGPHHRLSVVRAFETGQVSLEERMWRICLNRLSG